MSDNISELKESEQKKVSHHQDNNWIGGVVLIVLGSIFLLSNLAVFTLNNWWALFILIPAAANLGTAWRSYQQHGRFTNQGRGALIGGIVLGLVASIFLFGWDWGKVWPVFLIIGGFSAILSSQS